MKLNKKRAIILVVALIVAVSALNAFLVSSGLVTGSSVTTVSPVEFPGISLAVVVASVLGGYVVIKQYHTSK